MEEGDAGHLAVFHFRDHHTRSAIVEPFENGDFPFVSGPVLRAPKAVVRSRAGRDRTSNPALVDDAYGRIFQAGRAGRSPGAVGKATW